MKKIREQQGFTLIELIVGMTIFSVVVVVISGIFTQTVKFQKIVANRAVAIDNLGLAMEEMVRGIRTAAYFDSLESSSPYVGSRIEFKDYDDRTIIYELFQEDSQGQKIGQVKKTLQPGGFDSLPITSSNVNITNLDFFIQGYNQATGGNISSNIPPRITISMTAAGIYSEPLTLQTTVGARLIYYQSRR